MKQSLMLIEEQIQSAMFSYDDMVRIVESITMAMKRDYPEAGSMAGDFIKALEQACDDWRVTQLRGGTPKKRMI